MPRKSENPMMTRACGCKFDAVAEETSSNRDVSFSFKLLAFIFGVVVGLWAWSGCDVQEMAEKEAGAALEFQPFEPDDTAPQTGEETQYEASIIPAAGGSAPDGVAHDDAHTDSDADSQGDDGEDENPNSEPDDESPSDVEPDSETGDCLSPIPVDSLTTVKGKTAFTGDTAHAIETVKSGCDDAGGPAEVWAIRAPYSGLLEIVMDTRGRGDFECSLSVRNECDAPGTELECDNDRDSGEDGVCTVTVDAVKGDIYYIIAGGSKDKGGAYSLELFNPSVGDTCGNPRLAYIDQDFSSDTFFSSDDYRSGCDSGSTGSDQVWVFTATFDGTIEVAAATDLGGEFGCALSVRESCHDAQSEVGCAGLDDSLSGGCRLTVEVKTGRSYYVFIDTGDETQTGGLYRLGIHSL